MANLKDSSSLFFIVKAATGSFNLNSLATTKIEVKKEFEFECLKTTTTKIMFNKSLTVSVRKTPQQKLSAARV